MANQNQSFFLPSVEPLHNSHLPTPDHFPMASLRPSQTAPEPEALNEADTAHQLIAAGYLALLSQQYLIGLGTFFI
jgi:hypothetical protein